MAVKDDDKWSDKLPLVLLGIRSTIKQDIKCCPAELVYGTTLRLPGENFNPATEVPADETTFVQQLRQHMSLLRYHPPRHQLNQAYMPEKLENCTHVFIRHDGIRKPLQPPYDGPFKVISRTSKIITVERGGKHEIVSIDRVKPAFMEIEVTECLPKSTSSQDSKSGDIPSNKTERITRSGRRVHWPQRFVQTIYF
ncbi:unnamed protein product [Trichobilharzia szidati]|nr:unnamed protein product [Trichobilharzia szidati]